MNLNVFCAGFSLGVGIVLGYQGDGFGFALNVFAFLFNVWLWKWSRVAR